jgi:hypothetical protein
MNRASADARHLKPRSRTISTVAAGMLVVDVGFEIVERASTLSRAAATRRRG